MIKQPKQIQGYGGMLDVHPTVWGHVLAQACDHKTWALTHEYADNPEAWPASTVSIAMLRERLSTSVLDLAKASYAYFHHRAHALQNDRQIDPCESRKWEELTAD